jgi:hypothetical protein
MLRGGTWDWSANMLRSGYRETAIVDGGGYSFRVVRTLNVQPQGRLHVGAFSLSGDDRLLGAAQ